VLTTAVGARVDKGLDSLNRVKNAFGSCNDESDCPNTPLSGRGGDGVRGRGRGGDSDSNCGQPCLLPLSGQHVSRDNTVVVCSNISAVYSDGPARSDSAQIIQLAQNYQHAETSGLPAGLAADAFFDCLVEAPELSRYRSAPVVKVQLVHIDTSGRQMIVDELQLGNEWLPKDFLPSAYPAVSRSPGGHDPLACSTAMTRIPALCNNTVCVSSGNDPQFDMQDWASMYGENCLASPSFEGIEGVLLHTHISDPALLRLNDRYVSTSTQEAVQMTKRLATHKVSNAGSGKVLLAAQRLRCMLTGNQSSVTYFDIAKSLVLGVVGSLPFSWVSYCA
jgi:hypothetical protein